MKKLKQLGVIKEGPEFMANFLWHDKRVQPYIKGEIFGGDEEFNLKVLELYLLKFDFKNKSILESMREYLSYFEMPGEG